MYCNDVEGTRLFSGGVGIAAGEAEGTGMELRSLVRLVFTVQKLEGVQRGQGCT